MNRKLVLLVGKKNHLKHFNHKKKYIGGSIIHRDQRTEYEDIEKRQPQHQKLIPVSNERQFLKLKL